MQREIINVEVMDTETLLGHLIRRTQQEMEGMFFDAFGVSIADGFREVEDDYEKLYGVRPNGNLLALNGMIDRRVLADDPTIDLSSEVHRQMRACLDAASRFLEKATPPSIYNEAILDQIAGTMLCVGIARNFVVEGRYNLATHYLLEAKFALGSAHCLLERRLERRAIASKGGKKREANFRPHREAALKYIAENIPSTVSAQAGASRMLKADVFPFSHGSWRI